jgi:type IV pilus assembly protein PilE
MRHLRGFTLIEVMITVAIVGILAAIAYPSYRDQIIKSRRSDGQTLLVEVAGRQERYYFDNASYADKLSKLAGYTADSINSPEGYYSISVSASTADTYTLTATAQGDQTSDGNLTLDNLGNKLPASKW